LFPDAFAKLYNPIAGIITVNWSIVACGITSPIILHNKDGTSQYWFAMQVVNSNIPVASLEVCTDGYTWQPTTRADYNFFENQSGFGTTTLDVRITSITGSTITVKGVSVSSGSSTTASSNFES
jgi:expansin